MFAELEKRVAFAAVEFFQIEHIFVKRDRLLDVVHFDHDMITTVNLHAHFTIYLTAETARFLISCGVNPDLGTIKSNPVKAMAARGN